MKKTFVSFLTILIVSVAIRLFMIDQPLLEFFPQRQTQTAEITRNIYVNGWADFWTPKVRYFTGQPIPYVLEFPLYNSFVALLYHIFAPNVVWGRLASIFFFVLSTIVFWKIFRKSCSSLISLFGILFFTFSPIHILTSRSFQPEELALFLILLAVYRQSWFILSLAALTKLPAILFAPLLIYQNRIQGKTWKKIIFRFLLTTTPVAIWSMRGRELTSNPLVSGNYQLNNWFQPYLLFDFRWYTSLFQIEQTLVLTAIGLLFFWIGFWKRLSTNKFDLWSLWFLCGVIYMIIFTNHFMVHEYYHVFLLPPLSIYVASGLNSIWKISSSRKTYIQYMLLVGVIFIFTTGLALPAIKQILSAPNTAAESSEISQERYNYVTDF